MIENGSFIIEHDSACNWTIAFIIQTLSLRRLSIYHKIKIDYVHITEKDIKKLILNIIRATLVFYIKNGHCKITDY